MNSNIDWAAVSAIGTCVGALATFCAVLVALFQPKWANRKKLNLYFGDNYHVAGYLGRESEPYIFLSATNVGNRKIIINSWGIKVSEAYHYIFTDDPNAELHANLPTTIEPEEEGCFFMLRKYLVDTLQKEKVKGTMKPNQKVKLFLVDSAGQNYYIESKLPVSEYWKMEGIKNETTL